jgi:hypothetical protein
MDLSTSDLGATTQEEVREAGLEAYGLRPDVSARPIEILREKVLEVAKKRLGNSVTAEAEKMQNGFAIFLLTNDLRHDRARLNADRTPNVDTGSSQLAGYCWIAPPLLNSAARIAITSADMGTAFDELEARQLGAYAAIVVDFVNAELRMYEAGVGEEENVIRVAIAQEQWPETATDALLQIFADKFLATPLLQPRSIQIWIDPENYVPVSAQKSEYRSFSSSFCGLG